MEGSNEEFSRIKSNFKWISNALLKKKGGEKEISAIQAKLTEVESVLLNTLKDVQGFKSGNLEAAAKAVAKRAVDAVESINVVFDHCKESSQLYDTIFLNLSKELSSLFKTAYTLLKSVIEILELKRNVIEQSEDKNVPKMMQKVVKSLIKSAVVLKDIDATPMGNTWRGIARLTSLFKSIVMRNLDLELLFQSLCTCIIHKLEYWFTLMKDQTSQHQGDLTIGNKLMKLLRFLANVLLQYVQETKNELHGKATESILHLLVCIVRFMPSSRTKYLQGLACYDDIQSTVLSVAEPLLVELLDARDFHRAFFTCMEDGLSKDKYPHLRLTVMLLNTILHASAENCKKWMETPFSHKPPYSILHLAFWLFGQCSEAIFTNLTIPMVVCKGQRMRDISIYEYSYVHICAYISSVPEDLFETVENCLLYHLFQSAVSSMLAADVWCFVSRWGSANLCWDHVKLLANLICEITRDNSMVLAKLHVTGRLMKRIFPFLLEKHQEEFLRLFPLTKEGCAVLWYFLPSSHLSERLQDKIIMGLFGSNVLHNLTENRLNWLSNTMLVHSLLQEEAVLRRVPAVHRAGLVEKILTAWKSFPSDVLTMSEMMASSLLDLTTALIKYIDVSKLLQIVEDLAKILKTHQSEILSLCTCKFLVTLVDSKKTDSKMLQSLTDIFQLFIKEDNVILSSEVFCSMRQLSQSNAGKKIVEKFMLHQRLQMMDQQLKKFSKGNDDALTELLGTVWNDLQSKDMQKQVENELPTVAVLQDSKKEKNEMDASEPMPKRARLDETMDPKEMDGVLKLLEKNIKHLKERLNGALLSEPMRQRLKTIQTELTTLLIHPAKEASPS